MSNSKIELLKKQIQKFENQGFRAGGRDDLAPYLIKIPFDWGIDPYQDRNWRFQLNTLRYLKIYLDLFNLTKESYYLDTYLSYLQDWANYSSEGNDFAWYDMATGIRAENISYLLEALKQHDISVPNWVNNLVLLHVKRMCVEGFIKTYHNHGMYVIHGLRSLTPYLDSDLQLQVLKQTQSAMRELFQSQFDEYYIHKEHSPHYHHLVTNSLGKHLKTGLYEDLPELKECYSGALGHQKHFYLPDGREIPFGDTDGAEVIEKEFSVEDQWDIFNQSGYLFAKNSNGSYLAFTNSYHSKVHKHGDNLSFIFGNRGIDIFIDPGKYKYANDDIRKKVLSSESHSVLNFKDKPWKITDIVLPISAFQYYETVEYFTVLGNLTLQTPRAWNNIFRRKEIDWQRKVIFHQKGFLLVIDTIDKSAKNVAISFTLDPVQLPPSQKSMIQNGWYQGRDFLMAGFYKTPDNEIIFSKSYCKEVPISKRYASYELTQQINFTMPFKEHITVVLLDTEISKDDVIKFYQKIVEKNE